MLDGSTETCASSIRETFPEDPRVALLKISQPGAEFLALEDISKLAPQDLRSALLHSSSHEGRFPLMPRPDRG